MGDGWDADRIPAQAGRIAIVTGANSGLGLVTTRQLARKGALVVLACRNLDKGRAELADVEAAASGPRPELEELDLASLDVLVNNGGVMAPPRRHTAYGFELQFGTNHLGHFAHTGLLLPVMEGREDARVVTLSSTAHKTGRIA